MEEVKRIYILLLHSNGLKIIDIAKQLDLDKYYVADIMFSSENFRYWYYDTTSLWYAKEGAIQIEEPKVDKLTAPLSAPKVIKVARYLQGHPSASLCSYIKYLANYRVYSDNEIKELFRRYRNGDSKAYDLIFKSSQKAVTSFAFIYRINGVQLEDLIQEGNLGLHRAIKNFDYIQYNSFYNYARNWIMQAISYSLTYLPYIIKLPANQYMLHYKVHRFIEKFQQLNDYPPSVNDIEIDNYDNYDNIGYLYYLPDNLKEITCQINDLDIFESNVNTIDDFEEAEYNSFYVNRLLKRLNGRDEMVVRMYFGIGVAPESLSNIGEMLNLTRERARQLLTSSINRLRNIILTKNENLDEEDTTSEPDYDVKALDVAKNGDYVEIPESKQLGRIISNNKSNGKFFFYVLGINDRRVYQMNKDGTLIKKPIKKLIINITPERKSFIYRFYRNDYKKNGATKEQDTTNKPTQNGIKDTKKREPGKKVPDTNTKPRRAKIGDRLLYDSKNCVVKEKRNKSGYARLIIEYDNGFFDNVPDNMDRYIVI